MEGREKGDGGIIGRRVKKGSKIMQTSEYRHCDKREKHALDIVTRASKKRSLATLKATIAKMLKKSEMRCVLMREHADACADLRKRK